MATNDDKCKKLLDDYEAVQKQIEKHTSKEVYFETEYFKSLRQTANKIAEQIQLECPEYFHEVNQTHE